MISVGIDVSKGKSTISALKPYGEVVLSPKDYKHCISDLNLFIKKLGQFKKEEIHIIMEATGNYHLPISNYFKDKGYEVIIVNPLEMKRYRYQGIRNPKTDRIDSLIIAQYGIDYWYKKNENLIMSDEREELRFLGKQYVQFMKTRSNRSIALCNLLDQTMPGIYDLLDDFNRNNGKDKLCDFVEEYWHRDLIIKYSENKFIERYNKWLKKKGYRLNGNEAHQLYIISKDAIPTLKADESTHMVVLSAVSLLKETNTSLFTILAKMRQLAKQMPEYETVMAMKGVGDSIGPRLIAEIGDPRRFHSAKALIAYSGIDAPPYQSGQFTGTDRHMSKRGSKIMRKLGYELIDSINKHQVSYQGDPVTNYFLKKRQEGKHYRVAMFAAYNKFLRIYHSRVSEVLNTLEA
ncbi:MAG: IS110 family transposase [Firmicutes bacterium]|nr:IS110 family transposase [Candidatus Colivicinus equi]